MHRKDIKELYYITPIANIPSILKYGILSHNYSLKLDHYSVAMQKIQVRRKDKQIPGTKNQLHDYANLYFDAHNPMLSKCRDKNDLICVLRIDIAVLDLSGIIIADRNASSDYARFYPTEQGLAAIDEDTVFARYWTHPGNQYEEWEYKSIKCAEVLVLQKVDTRYVLGVFVANQTALAAFNKLKIELTVETNSGIFF